MKIIVPIKQVPDTTEIKLDPRTGNLLREGVSSIINPDDRHALEAALRLRDEHGGRLTVLSMGPDQAIDALSEALGLGADEGVLLTDQAFAGADTWATSSTLARAIQKIGDFDLICCGRQAIDGDTAQVGPQLAEILNLPQVTSVCGISAVDPGPPGRCEVLRRSEIGYQRLSCPLPALLAVVSEMNTPRDPHMERLLRACRTQTAIRVWNCADIGLKTQEVGLAESLTQVVRTFPPKTERKAEILKGDPRSVAGQLVDRLHENKLI